MNTQHKTTGPNKQKPLRLWPGIMIVVLQWFVRFGIPAIAPGLIPVGIFGGLFFGLILVVWWAFFSRAPRIDRWLAILLMIAALPVTFQFVHKSIETGMMGIMFPVYSIPVLCLAFVIWAVASRKFSDVAKRVSMVATILAASGIWVVLRTNGMDGEAHQDITWRWATSPEERLLVQPDHKQMTGSNQSTNMSSEADWPGFRGLYRDGVVHGVIIRTDWNKTPPVQMWRRPIGPGCSSFAILGNMLYTQEQRGAFEMVTCYHLNTGEPVWRHSDSARFWDAHAGAGPRSTPALCQGRLYTLGATGILNVLDAQNGSVFWSHQAALETKIKIPEWGYTSSPLVIDSIVIVSISGKLIAYDRFTGHHLWSGPDGGESYSSPHLLITRGRKQILFLNRDGFTSYSPTEGKKYWQFPFANFQIVQPGLISENDFLIPAGYFNGGMKRITIKNGPDGWNVKESWTSDKLKPTFNDFVIHNGYAYGFNGPCLACMDINHGNLKWQGGRFGGQVLLLADQDLLLVLSEQGELALIKASPEQFKELARFPAIKGKTWNHPVLVGNILVVRNSQEMAAFRLTKAGT